MITRIKNTGKILFLSVVMVSCNTNTNKTNNNNVTPNDTPEVKRDLTEVIKNASSSPYNNFARFIAGLPQTNKNNFSASATDSLWINYASKLKSKWDLMSRKRTAKLNVWAEREVPPAMRASEVLFYPFSGADILNANLLFPQTKTCYMYGLEPVGYIPDALLNNTMRDSLYNYFNALNQSLDAITNYSFFRTNSMKVDFKADELNGTIHLMLLFLSRNGYTIADLRHVYVNENGKLMLNTDRKATMNDGVEITYLDSLTQPHTVTYFSVNLDNAHYGKNKGMQEYISKLGTFNTYLKAATYLMHNASFSMIRSNILDQSKYVLQDDSGIPYKFFSDTTKWKATLYGVYVPPIPLFANYYEADLNAAYADSTRIPKPLNFGIGYNFNQSNLVLYEKK